MTLQPQDDATASAFVPESQELTFNGKPITVLPLTVLQAIQISKSLKLVLPALDSLAPILDGSALAGDDVGLIVQLLADYGEPLTQAVAVATGLPLGDVQGSRDMPGLITLIAAIIRINTDFFAQQAAPRLAGLQSEVTSGDGQTQSTGLLSAGMH